VQDKNETVFKVQKPRIHITKKAKGMVIGNKILNLKINLSDLLRFLRLDTTKTSSISNKIKAEDTKIINKNINSMPSIG